MINYLLSLSLEVLQLGTFCSHLAREETHQLVDDACKTPTVAVIALIGDRVPSYIVNDSVHSGGL